MRKIDFNKGWEFAFDNEIDGFTSFGLTKYGAATGPAAKRCDYLNWEKIDLPHDWAVALPVNPEGCTFKGAKANSHFHHGYTEKLTEEQTIYNVGWYRKQFDVPEEWQGKRVFVEFEGIYRDAIIWVNGVYMTRHASGYTRLKIEITDHLFENEPNSIAVRVDSDQPEGWWYEGSGIYRNVWLKIAEPTYILPEKTAIKTELNGLITVNSVIVNDSLNKFDGSIEWKIFDRERNIVTSCQTPVTANALSRQTIALNMQIDSPIAWDLENPYLYVLEAAIGDEIYSESFGIRTVGFDSDKGFMLNGKPVKIRGACNHHDFGGVGVALSDNLNYYKIKRLKDMGVNAYRSSHNAPSPALLDACDKLGMLVMDETRLFGTSPEAVEQLTSIIERDRNHPCVFIWSLGNEEVEVQNRSISYKLMEKMTRIAKTLDDTRPVTYGGNNGDNFIGANAASEIRGVNYIRNRGREEDGKNWLDCYHEDHPEQPIIGTEESSYVLSRGGMKTDLGSGELESFGNVTMGWGSTPKGWVKFMEERDYFSGSFMWTGFDYRGEPNPFVFTNFSSSFGTIDLCGIEKPPFYYYKAWWTDQPVLKLATHWNHTEGENVKIAVFTNCDNIVLYLNGKEIAKATVEKFDLPQFTVKYEAGVLEAIGTKNGKEYRDKLVTADEEKDIKITPSLLGKTAYDVCIYELSAIDNDSVLCPLSSKTVDLSVENGKIIAVCNGNPASTDYETIKPTEKSVTINKFNYKDRLYSVPPAVRNRRCFRYDFLRYEEKHEKYDDDFRLVAAYKYSLTESERHSFTTSIDLSEDYEYIEFERLCGKTKVFVDGIEIGNNINDSWTLRPYRFYFDFDKGRHEIEVVGEVTETDDDVISGNVKIGKTCAPAWKVSLHYGKAIVLVKSEKPNDVKLSAKFE